MDMLTEESSITNEDRVYAKLKMLWKQASPETKDLFKQHTEEKNESTRALNEKARLILEKLNEKAGRRYRPSKVNLKFITQRLKDGITENQLLAIIIVKTRQWQNTDMEKYLRPETLFNATKCEQYLGEIGNESI